MSFAHADEGEGGPVAIMRRLIEECPEFRLLRDAQADIAVYMRADTKVRQGKQVIGTLALPAWQGALAPFAAWLLAESREGGIPAYLMILDAQWWEGASAREREALVFHELMHAEQARDKEGEPRFDEAGLPVWAIREHDITAFNAEVARYGPWHSDIVAFLAAARENRLGG